jgi:hypothetical protein
MDAAVYVVREWEGDGYSTLIGVFTDEDHAKAAVANGRHRDIDPMQIDTEYTVDGDPLPEVT